MASDASSSRRPRTLASLFTGSRKRARAERDAETAAAELAAENEQKKRRILAPFKPRHAQRDAIGTTSATLTGDSALWRFARPSRRCNAPANGEQRPMATPYKPRHAGRDAMLSVSVAQRDDVQARLRSASASVGSGTMGGSGAAEYRRTLSETGLVSLSESNRGLFSSYGGRWLSTGAGGVTAENAKVRFWGRDAGHDERVLLGLPSPKASMGDLRPAKRASFALPLTEEAPVSPRTAQAARSQEVDLAAAFRRMDGGDFDLAPNGRPRQPLRHTVSQPDIARDSHPAHPALRSVASTQTVRPYTYKGEIPAAPRPTPASLPRQIDPLLLAGRTSSYADLTAQRRGSAHPIAQRASTASAAPAGEKGKERAVVGTVSTASWQPASVAPVPTPAVSDCARAGVMGPPHLAKDSRQQSLVVGTRVEANQGTRAPPSHSSAHQLTPVLAPIAVPAGTSSSSSEGDAHSPASNVSFSSSRTSIASVTRPATPPPVRVGDAGVEERWGLQDTLEELKEMLRLTLAFQ